ncbi:substrate-binding domain-containing protein [Microbacterium aquimaris]|uniref:Substrate-binding domain-containing protein n=1 Tax=Microbacterium aquimaris TaxID=459816 RepID=A0ABU5N5M0_9MICO|nr:substrate-binding domain-containing protein [Microbacterium aquimaris]MDZ8161360.1 substrate-binding domain-containing protein [Microbacterium aquimaris]
MKRMSTHSLRRRLAATGTVGLATVLALSACSQGEPAAQESSDSGAVSEATDEMPAELVGAKIAIVQQSGQGDYFQQYLNGTRQQAEALGFDLSVYDAQGDNATQATQLEQAVSSGVDAIIVRHGFPDTLCPGVNDAISKGIAVIAYDVNVSECADGVIQTQQSDEIMAQLVLDRMYQDIGDGQPVGYVNVEGIAPLDRRDAVWREYVADNGWEQMFKTGSFTSSSASDSAPMVAAAAQANPEIVAVYAPYDEFTKGTLTGLDQVGGSEDVLVYGADISNADIELMRAEGSRWVATGATDPNAIGAAVLRTLALSMAGELDSELVEFPPVLVTQEMLRDDDIQNMDGLRAAVPELNLSQVSAADWMPVVSF